MLQVTDTAVTVFRKILAQDNVQGSAIRLAPTVQDDGETGIQVQPIDQPAPTDRPTQAEGVEVVVASELAPALDEAVLDARETDRGADLFLREQGGSSS
jgi:Fe-S cluster assembly iron-binding protein IscA